MTRRIRIEYEPVRELVHWPRNPKEHDEAGIADAIDEFGFVDPIVFDETTGRIVAGHGRSFDLLRREKNQEVPPNGIEVRDGVWCAPVIRGLAFESEAHAERYLIASNRLVEKGGYNDRLLASILVAHSESGQLRGTGYSESDVDSLLERIGAARGDLINEYEYDDAPDMEPEHLESRREIEEDEAPEVQEREVSKFGQLWILGDHRLLCGSSYEEAHIREALGGAKPDIWFTDPPYNVGAGMKPEFWENITGNALGELSSAEWDQNFDPQRWLKAATPFMPDNGSVYVCGTELTLVFVWAWLKDQESKARPPYVVWCKPNPMPSLMKRSWTSAIELIAFGQFGKHVFNFPEEGHAHNFWLINKSQKNDLHPTQKPVAVPAKGIEHSSLRGQLVLDMFGGSGSTLIACEQLGRRCAMLEMSPKYVDRIIRRWQTFTGRAAICSGTGETFADHEARAA
jgi:DNA modification methylase